MSNHAADNLERLGYFLPEDSQHRLAKLGEHMEFLSRLAQPRTSDAEQEWAPEIRMGELAVCLELLAEQVDLVLAETSWSASRHAVANAEEHDNACDDEPEAMPDVFDAAGKRLVFGLTLDQVDALNPLVRTISAHGDVLAISDPDDLADGTVPTLGQVIQDAAIEVQEILDQLGAQRLVPRPRPRTGVGEARSAYAVVPWSLATDGARDLMSPLPAHRVRGHAGQPGRARLH